MSYQGEHEEWALKYTALHHADSLGAIRSALGDAAHMCDAIERDILTSRKRITKEMRDKAATAKRCGDAIWQLRSKIGFSAQAGEAQRAETRSGSVHEHAVPEGDAP